MAGGIDIFQKVDREALQGEDVPRYGGAFGRGDGARGEALREAERGDVVLGVEPERVEGRGLGDAGLDVGVKLVAGSRVGRKCALLTPARVAYSGSTTWSFRVRGRCVEPVLARRGGGERRLGLGADPRHVHGSTRSGGPSRGPPSGCRSGRRSARTRQSRCKWASVPGRPRRAARTASPGTRAGLPLELLQYGTVVRREPGDGLRRNVPVLRIDPGTSPRGRGSECQGQGRCGGKATVRPTHPAGAHVSSHSPPGAIVDRLTYGASPPPPRRWCGPRMYLFTRDQVHGRMLGRFSVGRR